MMGAVEDGEIRASDAERQAVIARLSAACGDGQLTLDEFSDRSGDVWAAVTRGQLDEITRDLRLPVAATQPAAPAEPTAEARPRAPGGADCPRRNNYRAPTLARRRGAGNAPVGIIRKTRQRPIGASRMRGTGRQRA